MPNKAKVPYSQIQHDNAIAAVKDRGWKVSRAAKRYGVPFATLYDKSKGRYKDVPGPGRKGRGRALNDETERAIVGYITYMSDHGFPLTRKVLKVFVRSTAHKLKLRTPFSENGPSNKWIRGFLRRHSQDIAIRTPDALEESRAALTQADITIYSDLLEGIMEEHNLGPHQIFNCDETGISAKESMRCKVIAKRGKKRVYQKQVKFSGHTTVLVAASAAGKVLPPLTIFQDPCPDSLSTAVPADWGFTSTKAGWINSDLFLMWFRDISIPKCGHDKRIPSW